jgi:hypothetical protein
LRQSGANKMAVTALTRDAGKRTIRVSDHQYNPPIEKAPLAGAFSLLRPAGRVHLEVKVLCIPGKGKC